MKEDDGQVLASFVAALASATAAIEKMAASAEKAVVAMLALQKRRQKKPAARQCTAELPGGFRCVLSRHSTEWHQHANGEKWRD